MQRLNIEHTRNTWRVHFLIWSARQFGIDPFCRSHPSSRGCLQCFAGRIFSRSGGGRGWTEVQGEGHSNLAQCKCSAMKKFPTLWPFVAHFLVVRGVKQRGHSFWSRRHTISSLLRNLPLCTPAASERYRTTSGCFTSGLGLHQWPRPKSAPVTWSTPA